jgi:hypothetical protein
MATPAIDGTPRLIVRAAFIALALALAACSNDEALHEHHDDAGILHDAGVPCPRVEQPFEREVSLASDLVPFFSVTCAFDGCHNERSREAGLFLGLNFADGTPDEAMRREIWDSLLAPATTTALPRVAPLEPERSFLLLKVQGCQNEVGLSCPASAAGPSCGARMPALSDPLSDDRRAMLSRWIADGAKP